MFLSRGPAAFLQSREDFFEEHPKAATVALTRWFLARKIWQLRGVHPNVRSMGPRGAVLDVPLHSFFQEQNLHIACSLFDVPCAIGSQQFPLSVETNMVAVRQMWQCMSDKFFHLQNMRENGHVTPWLPIPNSTAVRKIWMMKMDRRWQRYVNNKWEGYASRWSIDTRLLERGKRALVHVGESDEDGLEVLSTFSRAQMRGRTSKKKEGTKSKFRRGVVARAVEEEDGRGRQERARKREGNSTGLSEQSVKKKRRLAS